MPPIAAAIGSAAERAVREMADRELALDLEADDQEEDGEQPVVDPVRAATCEARRSPNASAQGCFPERREARRPAASCMIDDRDDRHQQQQHAGRRRPAREVERRGAHAMAERAEHRLGERALVPGAVVAPAVDEERRRERARRSRARSRCPLRRARAARGASGSAVGGAQPELRGDDAQVLLGQRRPSASSARRARSRTPPASRRARRVPPRGGAMSLPVIGRWRNT